MTDPVGALRNSLRANSAQPETGTLPEEPSAAYAVSRFLLAWSQAGRLGPDQAVLLRQALRWSGVSSLFIGTGTPAYTAFRPILAKAGVDLNLAGELRLRPFQAPWLRDEGAICDDPPRKRAADESFPAEAYLQSVGYGRWRSPAQKEAAWVTLRAPDGATRLIVLPTGSGKSLCFQLLPRFSSGLTVVVVPTIALAIDQKNNASRIFGQLPDVNPLYFAADDDPEATLSAVKEKRTRLIFTSPEACVSGRLRPILNSFAAEGWLTNLVVDEAHLIETWGSQFRVEFQLLAAARRVWRKSSGDKLRTFLFSATLSRRCQELLETMFSNDESRREFTCQRLRPEIQYYSHRFGTDAERDDATITSLWHLPRPAILYVTERDDAEAFSRRLQAEGFSRLEVFHGDTNRRERKEILRRWKANEIDLIVATSAFGLGVDKSDVRTVLHACYPENLDRYYQEIGRGGRDGWSSISLLLTSPRDRHIADGISVRLMRPESIQERWEAMFTQSQDRGEHVYALPVGSRRTRLRGTRTYAENIRWNKRLLLQLERAGLLELLDIEFRPAESPHEDPEEWAVVRINFSPSSPRVGELVEAQRNEEVAYFKAGLDKLDEFLENTKCAGVVIAKLYGISGHQRGCPGCPFCRAQSRTPPECEVLDFPPPPKFKATFQSELVEGCPLPTPYSERAGFVDAISRCVMLKGLRQFYCAPQYFDSVMDCFKEAFPMNTPELHRLDSTTIGSKLSSAVTPPITFVHIGTVNQQALTLGRGIPSVHVFCGVHNPHDHNGRHIAVNEQFRRWPSLEAWFAHPSESSLPCLPMTL